MPSQTFGFVEPTDELYEWIYGHKPEMDEEEE
jgi:hypothetical protein